MLHWGPGPGGHERGRVVAEARFGFFSHPGELLDSFWVDVSRPGSDQPGTVRTVKETELVAWRTFCVCGWMGGSRSRRRMGALHPSRQVELAALEEWTVHAETQLVLARLLAAIAKHETARGLVGSERTDVDHELAETIRAARELVTWQEIGDALGVTRQAALDRLGRFLPEVDAEESSRGTARMVLPLTDDEIRARYRLGFTLSQLADQCQVSSSLIWRRIHFTEEASRLAPIR